MKTIAVVKNTGTEKIFDTINKTLGRTYTIGMLAKIGNITGSRVGQIFDILQEHEYKVESYDIGYKNVKGYVFREPIIYKTTNRSVPNNLNTQNVYKEIANIYAMLAAYQKDMQTLTQRIKELEDLVLSYGEKDATV